eukprot:7975198-Karenia_brevis.AAC.1
MSQKQRKLINEGIQEVNREDEATRVCLKATAKGCTNPFETYATILCSIPMIAYGVMGAQSQR